MPGKIHVPVTVATDGFSALQRTFSRLRGVTVGLTAAIGGLGVAARALDFGGAAVQGARDLERNYAGLESVFKQNTEQMKEFGQTASEMGLSMNEAAKATTFIGSVLKQSGFSIQETSDLTEELVTLGADLALTYGYDVQEALLGMTALFRGEYDPIEKFGVAMKQSEIDAEKAARGLDGLTGAAERFADQQIRVEFLMERAGDAIGAFDRQSGNLTVQQMRLRAEFENIRDTVAVDLLPILADITGEFRTIVQDVGPRLEKTFSNFAPVLEELGRQIVPALKGAIDGLVTSADFVIAIIKEAQDPTTELGDSMQALGDSFARLFGTVGDESPTFEENLKNITELLEGIADAMKVLVDTINTFRGVIPPLVAAFVTYKIGVGAATTATKGFTAALLKNPVVAATAAVVGLGVALAMATQNQRDYNRLAFEGNKVDEKGQVILKEGLGNQEDYVRSTAFVNEAIEEYNRLTEKQLGNTKLTGDEMIVLANIEAELGAENIELINQQRILNAQVEAAKPTFENTKEALEAYRDITYAAHVQQANLNAALLDFNILARSAVNTGTLQGILEASQGKGMAGGKIGWDAQAYLESIGLITTDEETTGVVEDFVGDFFGSMQEEIAKQEARLDLQAMGLSAALIDQIVGSQGWKDVFDAIIAGGADMARELQFDFNQTAAGIKELEDAAKALAEELQKLKDQEQDLKDQITATETERADALKAATEQFYSFKESINLTVESLDTYERAIGRFESQTRSDLQRIEGQIQSAFDNGYLLEQARDNLIEYARAELNTLAALQRQRDELLARRNAAADVILGVADAVVASGNITQLLRGVQDEVEEVEVQELFERMSKSADGLRDFKVTVERNYVDVITNTVNKSQALVSGFQSVIDSTRAFIDNLEILRELGLDPFLFNQLVEAGAEAGGATAQALVEGGADTVNEVNRLQGELEAMGVELGEKTYEVTKNSGEQFVSGILDGIDAELENAAAKAQELALSFTETFELMFSNGMEAAFETITDTIETKFEELIDKLEAKLDELEALIAKKQEELEAAERNIRVASGNSIMVEGVEVQEGFSSIGPGNIGNLPGSEQAFIKKAFPELFENTNAIASTGTVQQTVVNNNYFGSEPLDLYKSSKQNVVQQSAFQSANGSIEATLSGVGN